MVFEELAVRLNDKGYKNWLKAGHCLRILKEGLHVFTNTEMRAFHGDLLAQHAILRRPCQSSCTSTTRNKVSSVCAVCSEWRTVILRHHRQPNITVNWDNCRPSSWLHDHWELAKAYMPRGQFRVTGADQCDASALLNLINHCDRFSSVDPKLLREVIRCRNELMHSCELRVEDEWMRHYQASLKMLLQRFNHVAEVATAAQRIHEMLVADWSVCVSRQDRVDAPCSDSLVSLQPQIGGQWETGADTISQWEVELLQETLQELLRDTETQHTEGLVRLKDFLQANRDLGEQFSEEIQALHSLGTRGQGHQRTEEDEDRTV